MRAPVSGWTLTVDGAAVAAGDTAVAGSDSVLVTRTLPALAAGVHALRAVVDTLGQVAESQENDNAAVRTLLVLESQAPIFVTGPSATLVETGARIAWTSNEPASGIILHGTTAALTDTLMSSIATVHADTLAGVPGLRHYFRVAATDTVGNTAWSAVDSFVVAPAINTPPHANLVAPQSPGFFASGDTLHLDGTGADAEDGSTLHRRWEVDLLRPGLPPAQVFTDSLVPSAYPIPSLPDSFGMSYLVRFIVTDTHGLADTALASLSPDVDLSPSIVSTSPAPAQEGIILIGSFWIRNMGRMPSPSAHWMLLLDDQVAAEGDVAIGALDSTPVNEAGGAGCAP